MTATKSVKGYLTNEGCVGAFFDNTYDEGHAQKIGDSNVFYIADTLYSYGYHFPMAIKLGYYYLVNADRYSPTTGKHQSYVQRCVSDSQKIEIPFSALDEAGIPYREISVVDKETSKYVQVERLRDGEKVMVDEHLMGSTLFTYNNRYFLSGLDETAKDIWNGFFLTELVGQPKTVEEAYEMLKPNAVKHAEKSGREVKRQGEYFFIKAVDDIQKLLSSKEGKKLIEKKVALKHKTADNNRSGWEFSESRHVVTNYVELNEDVYVKGTCRHVAGEHRMLKLDEWYKVFENTQVQSWSSNGRVD
jgi:hypothetical protein